MIISQSKLAHYQRVHHMRCKDISHPMKKQTTKSIKSQLHQIWVCIHINIIYIYSVYISCIYIYKYIYTVYIYIYHISNRAPQSFYSPPRCKVVGPGWERDPGEASRRQRCRDCSRSGRFGSPEAEDNKFGCIYIYIYIAIQQFIYLYIYIATIGYYWLLSIYIHIYIYTCILFI